MSHVRQQIRQHVATLLAGVVPGATVYQSRVLPLDAGDELPALLVYARSDEPEYSGASTMGVHPVVARRLALHVEGYAQGDDDDLDDIAVAVETALFADASQGGLAIGTYLGAQDLRADGEGETQLSVIDMEFTILYRVAEGAPGTAL